MIVPGNSASKVPCRRRSTNGRWTIRQVPREAGTANHGSSEERLSNALKIVSMIVFDSLCGAGLFHVILPSGSLLLMPLSGLADPDGGGAGGPATATQLLNAEVLLFGSVAVAARKEPDGTALAKVTVKLAVP